ncbi:MAG: DUF1573 domain-containing protein [Chitinophagales bacterium]
MKKLLTLFALVALTIATKAQTDNTAPVLSFTKTEHDFGTLKKGGHTTCRFEFQNTGKSPLIISRCQQSCGCTSPHCPTEAILPGAKSFVEVHYDSLRVGPFTKTVTVTSNASNANVVLTIKGNIEDAAAEASPSGKKEN